MDMVHFLFSGNLFSSTSVAYYLFIPVDLFPKNQTGWKLLK